MLSTTSHRAIGLLSVYFGRFDAAMPPESAGTHRLRSR